MFQNDSRLALHVAALIDISGGPDACHPCAGRTQGKGYVQVMVQGKRWAAHRYVYTRLVDPIPPGWEVDHECHNADPTCEARNNCPHRRCCNPRHLRAISHRDNVLAGKTLAAQYLASIECKQGHPRTLEMTFVDSKGARRCRLCYWIESPVCKQGHAMTPENTLIYRDGRHHCRTCKVPAVCKRGHAFTPENTITESNGHRKCRSCANARQRISYRPNATPRT